jgi:hypothetical protein
MPTNNERFTRSLHIRLTDQQWGDIEMYCREKGIEQKSELVREAAMRYIHSAANDATFVMQSAQRAEAAMAEIRDMIDVLFRYVRLAHINMLAYHPEIDAEFSEAAFNSANSRHDKFVKAFQESLRGDPAFFERLLHVYFREGSGE